MNASFNQISTGDAAKMLGVDRTSIANWCRTGLINFIDVSEPNSNRPRYVLPEDEVDKIKRAIKKYGIKTWQKHYKKNNKPVKMPRAKSSDDLFTDTKEVSPANTKPVIIHQEEPAIADSTKSEAEKITNTIMYIKDIKERLEDLEAEKNQLLNELETFRKEVLDYI